jgi:hypothetical protein
MDNTFDRKSDAQPDPPVDVPVAVKAVWSRPTIERMSIKRTMTSGIPGPDLGGKSSSP